MGAPLSISSTGRNIMAQPSADGDVGRMGTMSVGDYYGRGSRVRQSEGWGWKEIAVIGAVALLGFVIWRKY